MSYPDDLKYKILDQTFLQELRDAAGTQEKGVSDFFAKPEMKAFWEKYTKGPEAIHWVRAFRELSVACTNLIDLIVAGKVCDEMGKSEIPTKVRRQRKK